MILTQDILAHWFREFNAEYFNNELPTPMFNLSSRSVRVLGCCKTERNWMYFGKRTEPKKYWYKFTITMNTRYDRSEYYLKTTFIHEMIHEWQVVTYGKADHRATFQNKAREINRKGGWAISTHSNLEQEGIEVEATSSRPKKKVDMVCILETSKKERFVACLYDSRVKDNIIYSFNKQKPKFYRVVNQETFANYPRTGRGETLSGRRYSVGSEAFDKVLKSVSNL